MSFEIFSTSVRDIHLDSLNIAYRVKGNWIKSTYMLNKRFKSLQSSYHIREYPYTSAEKGGQELALSPTKAKDVSFFVKKYLYIYINGTHTEQLIKTQIRSFHC